MATMTTVITTCPFCGANHSVEVRLADYNAYCEGGLVQDCFPYLSADEREMLISGICPQCWDNMFGSGEEDDLDYEDEDFDDDVDECGFDPYEGCYTFDC